METETKRSWTQIRFLPPPTGVFVHTKVMDEHGERNFQEMKFERNLWWTRDGMYVYYQPTHWAYAEPEYKPKEWFCRY